MLALEVLAIASLPRSLRSQAAETLLATCSALDDEVRQL